MKFRGKVPALAAVMICACGPAAQPAQLSAGFLARIAIQTSCTITTANLNFGNVGIINGGETASAAISVICSLGTPYTISFSPSSSVTSYNGLMVNGAANVAYSAALSAAGGTGPGTHVISGVLPPQPTPASGIYTDNRTVYLNY